MPVTQQRQRGFSLLEVMIAVVIVSIGFLATARMQIEGLRASQSAYFISQANFMVREMSDRMRANPAGVALNAYKDISTSALTSWPQCMNSQTVCTPDEVAAADLAAWSRHLYPPPISEDFIAILPSSDNIVAEGRVEFDATTNTYTIDVVWSERVNGVDAEQILSVQVFP